MARLRSPAPITMKWTLALLALAVVLRTVQMAARSNLWFDELALALNVRERGFLELARRARARRLGRRWARARRNRR